MASPSLLPALRDAAITVRCGRHKSALHSAGRTVVRSVCERVSEIYDRLLASGPIFESFYGPRNAPSYESFSNGGGRRQRPYAGTHATRTDNRRARSCHRPTSKTDGFSVIEMEEAKRAKQKRDHRASDNSPLGTFLAQTSNFDTRSKICRFA